MFLNLFQESLKFNSAERIIYSAFLNANKPTADKVQ